MIRAVLSGLLTAIGVVAAGTLGSYLFFDPPVHKVGDVVVYEVATIAGLGLFAVIGFASGFMASRERRQPPRAGGS